MDKEDQQTDMKQLLDRAEALGKDIKRIEAIDIADARWHTEKKIHANHRKIFMNRMLRYAGMFTLPLLLALSVMLYIQFAPRKAAIQYAQVTASAGSVIRYELPDKSVVWLNAGSSLRYPTKFAADRRNVDLRGEAYFEITADKKHPFYVNTPSGLQVYVYGTKFNVSAYDDDSNVETVLEKGCVNVNVPHSTAAYKMLPGQCFSYNKYTHAVSMNTVDVYEMTAWKEKKLVFRDASLETVLKRLSRHFNVDIVLRNHNNKEYQYHATFREETLPQILTYLSKSVTMRWQKVDSVQQDDDTLSKEKIIVDLY